MGIDVASEPTGFTIGRLTTDFFIGLMIVPQVWHASQRDDPGRRPREPGQDAEPVREGRGGLRQARFLCGGGGGGDPTPRDLSGGGRG